MSSIAQQDGAILIVVWFRLCTDQWASRVPDKVIYQFLLTNQVECIRKIGPKPSQDLARVREAIKF